MDVTIFRKHFLSKKTKKITSMNQSTTISYKFLQSQTEIAKIIYSGDFQQVISEPLP